MDCPGNIFQEPHFHLYVLTPVMHLYPSLLNAFIRSTPSTTSATGCTGREISTDIGKWTQVSTYTHKLQAHRNLYTPQMCLKLDGVGEKPEFLPIAAPTLKIHHTEKSSYPVGATSWIYCLEGPKILSLISICLGLCCWTMCNLCEINERNTLISTYFKYLVSNGQDNIAIVSSAETCCFIFKEVSS